MLPEKLLHPRGSLWRRGLTAALIAATLLRCAVSPGTVSIYFGWAGGVAPTNLPKVLYLYGYIVAPGSSVHVATSGPDLYSSGATLNFGNVPNGSGLILTIELLDSNGAAANVIAYGQSAPFSLEPGKNVVVNVALELHTVTSVPSSGGIAVNGLANGEIGTPLVSLELYADPSAVGAQISNLPALPAGDGTMTLKTLTPDPTVTPPSGFKAYRYTGWDLEAGLPSACTTLCQRSVYVFFTDAEGIQSATSSTTVTLNRQKPTLSTHVTPQPVAGLGATIAIVATPSEPLGVSDAGIADITPHVYALADTTQEDELPNFLGAPLPNTEFTYEHPVTAVDLNGSYYAVFALQDIAGNTNVVGLDQSIQFAIDTTAPVIQHLVVSRGGAPDAGADAGSVTLFSQVAGYDQIHVTFDSTKPLVTCTAGIGGAQTACTPEPAAGANSYSWDYSVTAKDAEGNHPFSLVAFDDANNEAQVPNVTVTLDFTPPGLIPTPPSALHVGIGQTEILTLTPSKTLSSAPLLKVSGPGMLAFSAPAPSTGGSGYTSSYQVQAGDPSGAFTTTVTMTDLVGNTTAPPLAGPVFNVDTLAPLVSNVQTDAATYSEVAGHDVVALTFDVPKSVGSGLVVTLGGRPMACNPWAATSPSYSCTYQVNNAISDGGAADTAGPKTIQITATDEANNTASGSATVTFDFTTPTLTPAVSPNPATATTTVSSLSVTASKVLSSAAVVSINAMGTVTGTVTPGATALEGSGEEWSTSLSGAGASGQFLVTVSGEDPVGHVATASLPFTIDTIVPVISGLSVTPNAGGNGQTFSEVSPYNVVTVTFNTPKASTITAQVGGAAMSCGQFSVGQPSYTCNYTVLGSEGSGTKIVAVTAADEVQNTSQASASVVFDFTSPALTPTVQPNPANASASPVLSVSSTKPLATAAVSPITPVGSATGTVTAATLNGSATLWSAALSGAGADGTFTIPVQGTDALGHAATASVSFVIDAITPVITNVATNAQTFSEVIPFNIVTVTFDTPKAAGIAAAIGGNAMSCGVYQQSSPRYSCSYTISTSGAEGSGTKTIALTAHDEVGNASQQSVSVVFDFAAPVLTPTAAPNPANASAAPELTIASTKPLATASIASIDGEAGAIGQVTSGSVTGSGTAWSAVLSGTGADGTFAIKVEGTDEVGHSATASTTFVVDGIVPTITNLQANAQTYSEVSPYNTVTVTFDTPKAATIGATVGGSVMSCATQSSTQTLTVYSCTYGISPHGQEGSGTKIVSVVALDEVDNTSQASTSVVFDFAALTLSPIVVPNPANASSAPVLTMATSKPLSAGPLVTVTPQAGATGNVSASTPSGSGTSWTSSIAGPGATGSFLLAMQAIDAVGHVATASTVFSIEAVPPVLAAVTTNATTYSEVNGFNQITLTFTSTEVLDTAPAQLTVQVGGKRMNCGTAQGTAPPYSYSCTDTVSLSDTAGTQAITIEAVDSAGNEATAGSSVTFDFTAPVLTPTVAPNPSNSTSSPVLTVAVSKALQNQPGIAISPTGSLTTGGVSGGGTSWSYPIRATGTVTGAFTITATGTDAVGHQASGSTSLVVNTVPTLLSDISTDLLVYSEVGGFNVVTLSFDSTEPLDTAPASLKVTIGSAPMSCGTYQVIAGSATANYACTYAVTTAAGAGTKAITITAVDNAGNQTTAGTSVTFDFTAPTLTPTVAPNPANAFAAPALTVASDKVLDGAPTLTITPFGSVIGTVTAGAATGGGTSWGFPLQAPGADGTFNIGVQGSDSVGHTSTASLAFTVDTVAPAIVTASVATDRSTYSEVTGFNVITLTFQTAKAATAVTVSGGASSWNACTYAAPTYTCVSAPLTTSLGSGTKTIAIATTDEVQNTSQASTSVVFDFTLPVLTPTAAPNPSNAASAPALSIASSKPLTVASVSSIVPVTGTGTVTSAAVTGGGTSWGAGLQGAGANGVFTISVSGTDSVGHTNTASTSFTIDAVTPTISGVATDAATYSEVAPYNTITLTFTTAKQATAVTVSGGAGSWNACTYSAPTYTCVSSALTTALLSGTKTIAVTASDEVGNTSSASTSVVFDFSVPTLIPTAAPNPANASSSPVLTIASSKPLPAAPITSVTLVSGSGSVAAGTVIGGGTSWSAPLIATAANGTFSIKVSGTDTVGHTGTATTSFATDSVVPTITNVATDRTTYSEMSPYSVITLTFNTAKQATVSVSGGAGSWAPCTYGAPTYTCTSAALTTDLGSGTKSISITATDEANNQSQAGASVVFDFSTPILTPTVAPNPANASSSPALTVASSKPLTAASVASITLTSGSGSLAMPTLLGSGTSWSGGLTASGDDGTFTIDVSGTDTVGHTGTASTTFTVDAIVPAITVVATDKTTYSDTASFNAITLTFNTAKKATTITVLGGAGSWNTCTYAAPMYTCVSRTLTTVLGSGTKTIAITAIDEVGNASTASTSVVFDFSTPTLTPTMAPNPANASSSPALTLASSKPLTAASVTSITRTSGTGSIAVPTLAGSGTSWSAAVTAAVDNGTFTINVSGTDTVGHTTTASTAFTVDTVLPTVTSVATDKATYSDAASFNVITLTFDTAKQATVTVSGGASSWNPCTYTAPTYTCVSIPLTTSLGSGTKTLAITATDEVGNSSSASTSVVFDFSTPTLTPTVAPSPANATASPVLTLASSKPLTTASVTSIVRTSGVGSIAVPTLTGSDTSWSAGLTVAGDDGTFTINVSGTDTVGHVSAASTSFTVDALVPTITNVATDRTTYSDATSFNVITLTFNTAKQATTVVVSGGAGFWNACTYFAPTYTCVSATLTTALGSGTKTIAITATDEVGNSSTAGTSVVLDFSTPVLTPTVAPNPANASSSPALTLASSKPLTAASVTSIVLASGSGSLIPPTLLGSGTSWSAALTTTGDDGTFTINVSGTDTVGHTSTASTSFTVDALVPTITNVATDRTTYSEAATFNVITLTFNTVKQATTVTVAGGANSWNACTYAAPKYTCVSNGLAGTEGSGTKTISITAKDEVGNTSQASASVVFDFTTPTLTPTAAPNPSDALSSPVLTVASSKPLTAASVTSIFLAAGTGTLATPTLTGSGTSWSAPLVASGDNGTFTINVSGSDTVGHTSTASTSFTIDAVVPAISSLTTDKATYSDAVSFNVITLTFNTTKQASSVTVTGGAGSWNPCTYAAPTYTCVSGTLTAALGSGTKTIAVATTDEVGNVSQASTSVVFDFSTPALTPTVAPNPANASSAPSLTVASSKPLSDATVTSIVRTSGAGSIAVPTLTGSGTSWSASLSATGDDGTFSISVSGTDTVGHTSAATISFTVDAVVPAISNVATDKTTYSDAASFDVITLTYNTAKPASTVTVAGGAGSWSACTYAAPTYTCLSSTLTAPLGSGTKTIVITATDEVGNTSTASASVVFDFTTPVLTPSVSPSPANASSAPNLFVASSKPLTTASVTSITRTSGAGAIAVPTLTGSGASWSAGLATTGDNGTFTINVTGTDTVGHTTTAITPFTVDAVVPAISNVVTDKTTYSDATSFNVITLTFNTAKQASTVTVTGGAGSWNACTYAAPTYTCLSNTLATSLGSGTKTIVISATDEVSNTSTASASIVLDFGIPTLAPTVAPNPANFSASPVLTLASSKPLTTASVTSITRASGSGSIAVPTLAGSGTSWSAGLTATGDNGTFTINVSGTDTVGHTTTTSTSFTLDDVVPTISTVAADKTTYSDAASFNVITLTFNTAKQATTVTVVGGAGSWNACTYAAPTYTCQSNTLAASLGSGTKTIVITATDEVSNTSTASVSVVFDFSTPTLTPTVAPNPASFSSSPALTVASSKPLTTASVTSITKTSGTGSIAVPTLTGSGTSWSAGLITSGDNGTFTINVSGTDTVGHTTTTSTPFTVDAVVPTISSVATDKTTYSDATSFNVITLTFNTAKQATTVTVSGGAGSWNACTYAAPTYTCVSTALTTGLGSGTKTIAITATDEVSNTSTASVSVVFDFSTPTLTPTVAPNPASFSSSPALTLASSKPLTAASVTSITKTSGTGSIAVPTLTGSGTSWSAGLLTSGDNGTFTINVSGTDTVGHTTTNSTSFTVDAVVPTISSVATDKTTYSDATSFNVITLTFNTAKQATSVTVSGGAGTWNACTYAAPTYTCVSTALTTGLGSGTKTIAIAATDEVGNTSTASTSVVFDFSTPALTPTVAPNPASFSSSPALTVASSKPLTAASVTSITKTSGAGSIAVPTLTGSGTSWSAGLTTSGDNGTFTINVSGTDTVGHTTTTSASFTVDAIVPTISSVATDKTTYSDAASFNVITLTFNTAKQATTVTVSGGAGSWNACTYAAPTYTCVSTALTAGLGSGTKTIAITATDEVSNTSTASASVVFDFAAPILTPTAAPNPSSAQSSPSLTVASSKPLTTASVTSIIRTSGTGSIAVPTLTGSGTSWAAGLSTSGDNGTFTINVSGTDTVGHTVTTSTAFTVDAVAPAISNATITGGYQNQRFSAHSGFKVVSFSFGANKRLDIDGGTLAATVGGYPFGCAYNPDGGVYYACTYNVAGTELAGGTPISTLSQATMPILLSAVDEVGNQATAQVTPPSVVFDFQAPYLTASSASPAPDASVGAGQSELIELQPSETLATGDGGTTLWPAVTFSGPISLDGGTGITIEVTIPASQSATGTETSLVAMTDLVGNTAVDAGPVFLVDTVEPVLTNVATYSLAGTAETSFSAESTYNTVVLKFNATKSLDYPHPAISLLDAICSLPDGGSPDASDCAFQCGAWTATAPNYTCNYAVTGHEQTSAGLPVSTLANATFPVTIEGEDEANNLVSGSTSVTFDFMPPALAASPAISYLPAPNMFTADGGLAACAGKQNVLTSVTAATTCTDIRASFAMTEQLSSNPVVTAADGGIAFSQTSVSGVSYIYDGTTTVAGTPPDNPSYGLMIGATDLVGNPATLRPAMQTLALDTTAPAVPNTAIGGPILYTRIPWGSAATNEIATYFVQGDAGSSEPNGSIFAYDGPGTTYDNIGQGWVGVDGSFGPLTLLRDDRAAVYLSAVDRAGNGSPLVATHNVSWTATFNGKTPGNVVTNPNIALANVDDPLGVTSVNLTAGSDAFGALNPGSGQATEIASYAALSSVNVSSLVTAFSTAPWVSVAGANKPVPTYGQAFVFDTARGVTVSFGGDSGGNNDTWEWNGSMWNQATPFSSPADRAQPCAAYDSARGVMVMFGGQTFDDTWEWNGINWTQLSPATSPVARYGSAMAYDAARGVSVLFGGQSTSGQGLNDTWEWTGTTWRQIFPTSSPPARSYHGMVYDSARGVAVLFGGTSSLGLLNDTWEWNGFVWTQVNCSGNPCLPLSSTPVARESQAMAFDAVRGLTVLFGGTLAGSVFAGDTWQWNGNAWIQSSPIASPSGRTSAAMAYDSARGVSVMFGGLFPQEIAGQTAYYVLNELWEWNGSTWTERTQPFELPNLPPLTNPPARSDHAMVVDGARGVAVLFGGIGDGNVLMNDTWEWNGSIWTQRSPATKPAIRADMGMVYDSARGVTVLFGGENEISGPDLNDTWEWNGTSWTQKTVNGAVTSPVARSYVSMVFDEARGVSVLFGGEEYTAANSSCSGPTQWAFNCNDTWEWNGSVWVQMTPTQSPPARWSAPMAYDSARGVSVLFGGNSLQGAVLTDTWEWNGQNWTQRTPALSPPSVTYGAMAYDAERGVSLLVGAVTSALEVWSWNGSTWTQESPPILPSLRYSIGMAYDGARGQAVLFGGAGGGYSDVLGDTWLLRSDLAGRSTDLLQFGFGNTGDTFATAQIAGVSITLVAGGTGYASTTRESDGSATPGVAIAGWDVSTGGRWHILASNAADSTAPVPMTYVTNSDWGISHDFFAENQFIDVAVFPLQSTGNGANGGRVALESPQMTVLYQHVESICSVSELSSCTCGSDETVCGPDGGLVCSDISADPLNCGGCLAADAGLVCANGTWCLNGRCACPGTEVTCEGVCTDTTSDPLNCGGCNAADAGYLCGPFRPCNASHCSTCQAGQALDAGTCGNDILIRTSSNQTGSSGVATIAAGSATAGDSLFVVVAPAVSGFFTSTVASNSGGIWSLVGLGNDSGQYLAVYSRTATASDSGSTITVTLETLAGDGGLIPAAAGLNATLIDVYSQSGATISVDANAFGGSGIAADLLDAGITTAGTAPAIAATGPNEVVLIAAVQQGSTVSTLPSGVATTKLTQNGGFLTGYYSLVLPGVAPTQQFTGGSSTSTWEIAQIALASSAH